jgi:ATP-binding protein involved in chromosome partitioning
LVHRTCVTIIDNIRAELTRVRYPGFPRDIVTLGVVRDITAHEGRATILVALATDKPEVIAALRDAIEAAVCRVPEIDAVDVQVAGTEAGHDAVAGPLDERVPLPGVRRVLAIASGKGGVGKSTVAVNLALALRARGLRVGLLDADIYGPSIPLMMGVSQARPQAAQDKRIVPVGRYGLSLMSMGFFLDDKSPVIWRGPMVMSVVRQFLKDVAWGELDILVVDLPPGTGDAQLTVVQQVPVAGGVIVTTPQDVALQDVRRGIAMFQTVNAPVIGVIENMSYYVCPSCGKREDVFAHGGGQREARALGTDFLGEIALLPEIRASMDRGAPLVAADAGHPVSETFAAIAVEVLAALDRADRTAVR